MSAANTIGSSAQRTGESAQRSAAQKGLVETDQVYENQRGSAIFGQPKFSAKSLLPTDRGPWSDEQGKYKLPKDKIQLPDPQQWEWVGDWMIDMSGNVDSEGWQYSFNWSSGFSWSSECTGLTYVRRRRWKRLRRIRVTNTQAETSTSSNSMLKSSKSKTTVVSPSGAQMMTKQTVGLGWATELSRQNQQHLIIRTAHNAKIPSDAGRVEAVRSVIYQAFGCKCICGTDMMTPLGDSKLSSTSNMSLSDTEVDADTLNSENVAALHCSHNHAKSDQTISDDDSKLILAEKKVLVQLFDTESLDDVKIKLKQLYEYLDFESSKVILTEILLLHFPLTLASTLYELVDTVFLLYSNKKQLIPPEPEGSAPKPALVTADTA